MENIKNISGLVVILAVIDVALLFILKILKYVDSESFYQLTKDSLSIIGVVYLVILIVSMVFNKSNK